MLEDYSSKNYTTQVRAIIGKDFFVVSFITDKSSRPAAIPECFRLWGITEMPCNLNVFLVLKRNDYYSLTQVPSLGVLSSVKDLRRLQAVLEVKHKSALCSLNQIQRSLGAV